MDIVIDFGVRTKTDKTIVRVIRVQKSIGNRHFLTHGAYREFFVCIFSYISIIVEIIVASKSNSKNYLY